MRRRENGRRGGEEERGRRRKGTRILVEDVVNVVVPCEQVGGGRIHVGGWLLQKDEHIIK